MWCTDLPHLVHLLTFFSLLGYVSPPQRMRGSREGMMAYAWCIGMPPLIPLLIVLSLLGYVSHNTLASRVLLPSSQQVSTVVQ